MKLIRIVVDFFLGPFSLLFDLWTSEFLIFDLKIEFYMKFPPWGRVLRSILAK